MTVRIPRRVVAGAVGVLALAIAGPASAAYDAARLYVENAVNYTGGGGPVQLSFKTGQSHGDDALGKLVVYASKGYRITLGQPAGLKVGDASATLVGRGNPATPIRIKGDIVAADPARYTTNTCAPGTHQAVWLVNLTIGGKAVSVPIYADEVTRGPEANYAGSKLVMCFPSPDVAESAGGSVGATTFTQASLKFTEVFTNPAARGSYTWRATFTPYTRGAGTLAENAAVEARSIVRLPGQLTLNAKLNKATGKLMLTGRLTAGSATVAGQRIRLYLGDTPRGVKLFKTTTTNAKGIYRVAVDLDRTKPVYLRSYAVVAARDATKQQCGSTSIAPGGCVFALYEGFQIYNPRAVKVRLTASR